MHDVDADPDDLVDRVYIDMALSPSSSFTEKRFYNGESGRSRLELSFRIRCNTDFYDPNCTTYCQATDNDSGHFECGTNGEKICLRGWTNITNNCLTRKLWLQALAAPYSCMNTESHCHCVIKNNIQLFALMVVTILVVSAMFQESACKFSCG